MSSLREKVAKLASGAPRKSLEYVGNGYARDTTGKVYRVKSLEQEDAERRYAQQGGDGRKATFFWNGIDRMDYVIKSLTAPQCGYLLVLSSYIGYDGMIVKSEKDTSAMTVVDMIKALRLPKNASHFYEFLSDAKAYGIITEDEVGRFYVTKDFHFRGKLADGERVVKTYITRLREMHREISANDIGLLYRMIPYMHRDTNILCVNPEEKQAEHVVKLNRKQLAEVVGVNPSVINRAVSRMIYDGRSVFAKITTATEGTFYMINPSVLSRVDRDYDDTVSTIFGLKRTMK